MIDKINGDLKYINQTEFTQEQLQSAYQYLKEETVNNIFADNYNTQELSTQQYFTSTPSQYEDNSYNPNQLLGLGYGDLIMIPTFKVGSTVLNTTTEIAPGVFNGGKTIINTVNKKADGIYDNVTLGTINQINNISPSVGNVLLDTRVVLPAIGLIEFADNFKGGNSPSVSVGTGFSIIDRYNNGGETP